MFQMELRGLFIAGLSTSKCLIPDQKSACLKTSRHWRDHIPIWRLERLLVWRKVVRVKRRVSVPPGSYWTAAGVGRRSPSLARMASRIYALLSGQ